MDYIVCSECGEKIRNGLIICPHCRAMLIDDDIGEKTSLKVKMKKCPKCGKTMSCTADFCPNCGCTEKALQEQKQNFCQQTTVEQQNTASPSKTKNKIITGVIIAAIIGVIIYAALPKCDICGSRSNTNSMYGSIVCDECVRGAYAEAYEKTYGNDYNSFDNKYGSSSTKCAHSGCTNSIASSGDTNCCVIHSNKCYECGCYIDEDAHWCMSCIADAVY